MKLQIKGLAKFAESFGDGNIPPTIADELRQEMRVALSKYDKSIKRQLESKITQGLKKKTAWYNKIGYTKRHRGLAKWRLNDLRKSFRKELRNRINDSLELIKTRSRDTTGILYQRFIGWLGNGRKNKKTASLERYLKASKEQGITEKHARMILRDQSLKMIGAYDGIVAKQYKAIGFFWRTMEDRKVVGNPAGLYPKGSDGHGDHYSRADKLYFYKDSWVFTEGLVYKNKVELAEFTDGMPSQAYNCRCWANNVYDLEDCIKALGQGILTQKGKAYAINVEKVSPELVGYKRKDKE